VVIETISVRRDGLRSGRSGGCRVVLWLP